MALHSSGSVMYTGLSRSECETKCVLHNCRGYNFSSLYGHCLIRSETPVTSPSDWEPKADYDYYNRNCG